MPLTLRGRFPFDEGTCVQKTPPSTRNAHRLRIHLTPPTSPPTPPRPTKQTTRRPCNNCRRATVQCPSVQIPLYYRTLQVVVIRSAPWQPTHHINYVIVAPVLLHVHPHQEDECKHTQYGEHHCQATDCPLAASCCIQNIYHSNCQRRDRPQQRVLEWTR